MHLHTEEARTFIKKANLGRAPTHARFYGAKSFGLHVSVDVAASETVSHFISLPRRSDFVYFMIGLSIQWIVNERMQLVFGHGQ